MKKALCICLIIAAVLLVAGGVCMTVGFFRNGGFPSLSGKEFEEKTLTFPKETKEIRTDLGVQDILVRPGEGSEICVRWFEEKNEPLHVASSDGVVSVTNPEKNGFHFFWDWFWYKEKKLLVTIELPAEFAGSLTLVTDTGNIEVLAVQVPGGGLTVRVSTGSVKIADCAFASAEIRATTGGTELENVTVGAREGTTGSLRIAAETGAILCRNVAAKDTELSASTGDPQVYRVFLRDLDRRTVAYPPYGVGRRGDPGDDRRRGDGHPDRRRRAPRHLHDGFAVASRHPRGRVDLAGGNDRQHPRLAPRNGELLCQGLLLRNRQCASAAVCSRGNGAPDRPYHNRQHPAGCRRLTGKEPHRP